MTITRINEIENKTLPKTTPIKEIMEIYIPNITVDNIPKTNGFIYLCVGSGGSGKSSMVLNFFRKNVYRGKFDNIFYFCPEVSYSSARNHPFKKDTDNLFISHDLTPESLNTIYNLLDVKKKKYVEYQEKKKQKIKEKPEAYFEDEEDKEEEEPPELEYSCLFIDDFADIFKNNEFFPILNKIFIKTRHLCLAVIITLQELKYFPLKLRKQITNISIFKPKNYEDWEDIAKEYFNLNKQDTLTLYDYVFDEPYNHLDVQTNMGSNKYFKNWNLLEFNKK